MRTRLRRVLGVLVMFTLAWVFVVSCGDDDSADEAAESTTSTEVAEEATRTTEKTATTAEEATTTTRAPAEDSADQLAESAFQPQVDDPTWEVGQGPRIAIDEAHFNLATADRDFQPFSELARLDGFLVAANDTPFTAESLTEVDILVIAGALNERNVEEWKLPTPSAFTPEEVRVVRDWVHDGGSLLLITDHMPFGGAAADLAALFGLQFNNGFAFEGEARGGTSIVFSADQGGLSDHPVTSGRTAEEAVQWVATYVGDAFTVDAATPHSPLLILPDDTVLLLPEAAWQFSYQTEQRDAEGMLQGVVLETGAGRVAAFGELLMFMAGTIPDDGPSFGLADPEAQNAQFLLNVLHWLAGQL